MEEINKVVIVCRPERFPLLQEALNEVGIYGMTVIRAEGCGLQGGTVEYYRGTKHTVNLLPKTKVELVVPSHRVPEIVAAAENTLRTGKVGDGKIFVYNVAKVIKIRDGAEGLDAVNGHHD